MFFAILENQQVRSVSLTAILKNKQTKQLQTEKIFAVGLTAQALSFMLHYSWLGQIFAVTDPAQNWYAHGTSRKNPNSAPNSNNQDNYFSDPIQNLNLISTLQSPCEVEIAAGPELRLTNVV